MKFARRLATSRWGRVALALPLLWLIPALTILVVGVTDNPHRADVGVVLGNKVEPDGRPSPMLQARLDQTVKLYRLGYFPRIIVSGGVGREGYNEPAVMRHYLETAGIPASVIDEDPGGANTWQTARNTARYLKESRLGSVLVISQYFHLPRCRLAFAKFGIQPVYTSHAPYWSIRDFYSLTREIAGWVVYDLRRPDPIDTAAAPDQVGQESIRLQETRGQNRSADSPAVPPANRSAESGPG